MAALPVISVCIPTWNYGRFMPAALESVLAQTFSDFEIIVCDNCSDDDTPQIVAGYAVHDPRIRSCRNEKNLGMVGNWNRCLELARGEYVKFLCADDLLHPACLETLLGLMQADTRVVLASAARQMVTEELQPLGLLTFSEQPELLPGATVIRRALLHGNLIGEPSAVLFRRTAAQRGFAERYRHIVDLELWLHILEQGWFAHTPQALCSFRQHGGQETIENKVTGKFIHDEFMLIEEYSGKAELGLGLMGRERARFNKARLVRDVVLERPELKESLYGELQKYYNLKRFRLLSLLNSMIRPFRKLP